MIGTGNKNPALHSSLLKKNKKNGATGYDPPYCNSCFTKVPLRFDPKIWKVKTQKKENKQL